MLRESILLIACLFVFIGCGSSSSNDNTSNTVTTTSTSDTTSPTPKTNTVTPTSVIYPKVLSVVVKTTTYLSDASITITFDKSMNTSTLSNTNITLKDGVNDEGTFSQDSDTQVSFSSVSTNSVKTFILTITTSVQDNDNTAIESEYKQTLYSDGKVIYAEVKSPHTSKVWLDRNLGAIQVCTAYNDSDCYGNYYQWGRNKDGHEESGSSNDPTEIAYNGANGGKFITHSGTPRDWVTDDADGNLREVSWKPCPTGFSVPTIDQLYDDTIAKDVTNRTTAYSNFLKMPSTGGRADSGGLYDLGLSSSLWAISHGTTGSDNIYFLSNAAGKLVGNGSRNYGFPVRCIKD